MKTIKEWFETLPEPYRSQAIKNCNKLRLKSPTNNIYDALMEAFVWETTPQGHSYWNNLYNSL